MLGAFCSLVRRYVDETGVATKEAIYRFKLQTSEDVELGAKVLALFLDPGIDGQASFAHVREQDGKTVWERAVRSEEPLANEPFFDMVERVDIDTVLLLADRRNGFMESFEHVLGRYRKAAPSKPAIVAGLMAYATNIGLGRMADISNLSYQESTPRCCGETSSERSTAARPIISCAAPSPMLTVAVSGCAPSMNRRSGMNAHDWSATQWSTTMP